MPTGRTQRSLLTVGIVLGGMGFGGFGPSGCGREADTPSLAQGGHVGPWRHLRMDDIEVDIRGFRPIRARYLQVMYDLDGREEVQSRSIVHLDLDRAVHSGPWDGRYPIVVDPLSEPGLVVAWRIQHAFYNGFDRVLTDRHLSLKERVMPGGAGGGGLLVGFMSETEHTRIRAVDPGAGGAVQVDRKQLKDGSVNILTLPYVLAAMGLTPGDRFTLPGFDMTGGPEGTGAAWRGAFQVLAEGQRTVKGRTVSVAEVLFHRLERTDTSAVSAIDTSATGHRMTRFLISREPPYLLGRANMMRRADGDVVFVRESLGLVDWAEQPLPLSDYADPERFLGVESGTIMLKEEATPPLLVPLDHGLDDGPTR